MLSGYWKLALVAPSDYVRLAASSLPTSFDLAPLALVSGRGAGGEGFCTVF